MSTARCPACSKEFSAVNRSRSQALVCPSCGCSIRSALRTQVDHDDDNPSETPGQSGVHRLYSDLEAEQNARRQRRWTLFVVLGVMGAIGMTGVLILVFALARTAPKSGSIAAHTAPGAPPNHDKPFEPRKKNLREKDKNLPPKPPPAVQNAELPEREDVQVGDEPRPIEREDRKPAKLPADKPADKQDKQNLPDAPQTQEQKDQPDDEKEFKEKKNALQAMLRTQTRAPKDEILKASKALASLSRKGKSAASRELCDALVRDHPTLDQAAAEALAVINEPLRNCVIQMLVDKDYRNRVSGVEDLGQLADESVPEAAVNVLDSFLTKLQQNPRLLGAPQNYVKNVDAAKVVNSLTAVTRNKRESGDFLKLWLKNRLRKDLNPIVRATAAANYVAVETPGNAVPVFRECLRREKDEGVLVTVIKSLATLGKDAKPAAKELKDMSNVSQSKPVRDEATRALKEINAESENN
jgi:HEAT repeat protein